MKKIFILILVHSCSWLLSSYFIFNAKPSQLRFSLYNYYSFNLLTGHFLKRLKTMCLGPRSNHPRVLRG